MRSQLQDREPLDDLEELGDDAIIAQQTEAHAPQPRANVSEESRSVVITEHPVRRDTEPARGQALPRSTGEATLVIRDRRALDELRKEIVQRQANKLRGNRRLYLWGGLGLGAFVLGGVVAFLATDPRADTPSTDATSRVEAQAAPPLATNPTPSVKAGAAPAETTRAVSLDELPVEPKRKH